MARLEDLFTIRKKAYPCSYQSALFQGVCDRSHIINRNDRYEPFIDSFNSSNFRRAIGTIDTAGAFGECGLTPYCRYVSGVCTPSSNLRPTRQKQAIEFFTIPRYLPVHSDARRRRFNSTAMQLLTSKITPIRSTSGVRPFEPFPHAYAAPVEAS